MRSEEALSALEWQILWAAGRSIGASDFTLFCSLDLQYQAKAVTKALEVLASLGLISEGARITKDGENVLARIAT